VSDVTLYKNLINKVIFVTGGATGIGAAMVRAFISQGAKVAFIDINKVAANELIKDMPQHNIWFNEVDVTNIDSLQLAIRDSAEYFGDLDVLINNVANDMRQSSELVTKRHWHECMKINLDPAFFASQAAYKIMKKNQSGSIINFSSVLALLGDKQLVGYTTAKAGLIGMTKSLADDFGENNIRVNAILPGWVATNRQLGSWLTEKAEHDWTQSMAIKQRIYPDDIAKLAIFLASDDSSLITGQSIHIDGGKT